MQEEVQPIEPTEVPAPAPEVPAEPVVAPVEPLAELKIPEAPEISLDENRMVELWNEAQANDGVLEDKTYKSLAGKGISKEVADMTIRGIAAERQMAAQVVAEAVGGTDRINRAFEWAAANLEGGEIDEINSQLNASTPNVQAALIRDLITRAGVGEVRGAVQGRSTSVVGAEPFQSREQLLTAQQDPRYKADPAYRAEVMQRLRGANLQ